GVVGDVRNEGLDFSHTFATYEPLRQRPRSTMNVVVRTAGDPGVVAGAVRRTLYDMAPDLAVYGTNTMHQRIGDSLSARRFQMLLLTVFAGVALFLAAVGIYGIMAYSVAQRSRSIGIRMALGATNAHVLRSVIRDGIGIVVVGAVIGLVLSLALSRSLASFVFGVSVLDPATFAGVAVVLIVVALAASYIPAVRATRVNPVESLSRE
ncbi:MAG: FtsX-like permease family protein, partial [Gemmatimonadales bacterium]